MILQFFIPYRILIIIYYDLIVQEVGKNEGFNFRNKKSM